jgi:hypothetical protein
MSKRQIIRLGFVGARTGELAVLCIIGDECRTHGTCCLHIDAMAARAGVCRSTAQNALCEARRLGLITRQERRRRGQPSLTNIVRIVSAEWRIWLDRGSSLRGEESKSSNTAVSRSRNRKPAWKTRGIQNPCPFNGAMSRPLFPHHSGTVWSIIQFGLSDC